MNWQSVTDARDPRLAPFRDLRGRDTGSKQAAAVADGLPVVREVLRARERGARLRALLCEEGMETEMEAELGAAGDAALLRAPRALLSEVVGYRFHRGCLACFDPPPLCELDDLGDRVLVLEKVEKGENAGTVLRSAAAFGVRSILIDPEGVGPWDRRVLRASRGLVLRCRVHVPDRFEAAVKELQNRGYALAITTVNSDRATPLWNTEWPRQLALCLGNEAFGISERLDARADLRLHIPMEPDTHSLNVATAAGIALSWLWARSPTPPERR
ncbi:MAG TPA: RNA methyltransferase [Bdellovibrionota bacterium]|jgi:tRNA G18 (ribose-2'-O)-methylase SpoU|nr:RNA methyltransferase [Bdellovibrionota bacterium]